MRSKFWKQQSLTDCAPVAILNALRWLGYYVSCRRHYKQIYAECQCSIKTGTNHYNIHQVLKNIAGLKVIRPRKMTIPRFKNFLRGRQTAIIFSFRYRYRGKGHCCLVIKQKNKIQVINLTEKRITYNITDAELDVLLRRGGRGFPALWLLEKV